MPSPSVRLVLASASPARTGLLRAAGVTHDVVVSGVDESDGRSLTPTDLVADLARRKAEAVARRLGAAEDPGAGAGRTLVLGCDSVLDLEGEALGKPADAADAAGRWRRMRGTEGELVTGHHLIDLSGGVAAAVARTTVRFGRPSDDEIDAYVRSGEPLAVAGAFTLDGRSAPFIDGIDGDPSNVIGLSLPLLRSLLDELGRSILELWA